MTGQGKINSGGTSGGMPGTEPTFAQSEPAKPEPDPNKDMLGNPKLGARGRGRGRPSKLTTKLMDDVCNMIREITPPHVACARVGITPQAMNAWRRRGKLALEAQAQGGEAAEKLPDEEKLYADFEAALSQALGDATGLLVRLNLQHAKKNPITAMRLLETFEPSFRQAFTTSASVSVKGQHDHNVSGGVDHRHAHLHANAGGAGGAGGGGGGASAGRLTVQGADAIRRDILLGGKTLEQARAELDEKKRLQGQVPVRALPEKAGE